MSIARESQVQKEDLQTWVKISCPPIDLNLYSSGIVEIVQECDRLKLILEGALKTLEVSSKFLPKELVDKTEDYLQTVKSLL